MERRLDVPAMGLECLRAVERSRTVVSCQAPEAPYLRVEGRGSRVEGRVDTYLGLQVACQELRCGLPTSRGAPVAAQRSWDRFDCERPGKYRATADGPSLSWCCAP